MSAQAKIKKEKEIIAEYETQVKGECVVCSTTRDGDPAAGGKHLYSFYSMHDLVITCAPPYQQKQQPHPYITPFKKQPKTIQVFCTKDASQKRCFNLFDGTVGSSSQEKGHAIDCD